MKVGKLGRIKSVTGKTQIVENSEAVAVAYALQIAKASDIVNERQKQYAINRAAETVVDEPRNGILAGS